MTDLDDPAVAAAPLVATLDDRGVLSLELDRPDALNALTDGLADGIEAALEAVGQCVQRIGRAHV